MKKLILITLLLLPFTTFAHPGRTAADGCHYCRTNCDNWGVAWNERHCHNAKALPQPTAPIKSTYGENGTGYTSPAPEYVKSVSSNNTTSEPNSTVEEVKVISTVKTNSTQNIQEPVPVGAKSNFIVRFFSWLF